MPFVNVLDQIVVAVGHHHGVKLGVAQWTVSGALPEALADQVSVSLFHQAMELAAEGGIRTGKVHQLH